MCTFKPPCSTRAQMTARHGTPEEFREACRAALGEISVAEYEAASQAYVREWWLAPEGRT